MTLAATIMAIATTPGGITGQVHHDWAPRPYAVRENVNNSPGPLVDPQPYAITHWAGVFTVRCTWHDIDWSHPGIEVRQLAGGRGWVEVGGGTDISGIDGVPDGEPGHILDLLTALEWLGDGTLPYWSNDGGPSFLSFLSQWYIDGGDDAAFEQAQRLRSKR